MPYLDVKNGEKILLDEDDYVIAKKYKWEWLTLLRGNRGIFSYAREGKTKSISAIIFGVTKGNVILHKNNDLTDFRRENILICSTQEAGHLTGHKARGSKKTSQYRGVSLKPLGWGVRDNSVKSRKFTYYPTEYMAAIIADYNSVKKYGDKAIRNFPDISLDELEKMSRKIEKEKQAYIKDGISIGNQGKKSKGVKTSKYVGVYWDKSRSKWVASIMYNRKKVYIGRFQEEIDAAKAYDQKAKELFGEEAKVNMKLTIEN